MNASAGGADFDGRGAGGTLASGVTGGVGFTGSTTRNISGACAVKSAKAGMSWWPAESRSDPSDRNTNT
ncbi:hypothetical protein GCM10025867_13900 [Frondihabitans sucicola]|uniref:Uncharacterized protein n=1 Tax=Frondihabitans sucicola TaxID=1268041 RepID=A0ABM8GL79_9MICO|nr:hypothetical protein [Frondihabitans sucicola]BDZ49149.1 hypothetical protein GCM10025867_13900 [Frondihabitans sucicola]